MRQRLVRRDHYIGVNGHRAQRVPPHLIQHWLGHASHRGRAEDSSFPHDRLDAPPCRRSAPTPPAPDRDPWIALTAAKPRSAVEFVEKIVGQRHLPNDAALAALEGLDAGHVGLNIDGGRRESEDFGDARAAPCERQAEEALGGRKALRKLKKTSALGGVFAAALLSEEASALVRLRAQGRLG